MDTSGRYQKGTELFVDLIQRYNITHRNALNQSAWDAFRLKRVQKSFIYL